MKTMSKNTKVEKILIFRNGTIGDTAIAIPSLKLIAQSFPNSNKRVLTICGDTNQPVMDSLLSGSKLIDGYICYKREGSKKTSLLEMRRKIKEWNPDILIYLVETQNLYTVIRDKFFFKSCGVKRMIGFPLKYNFFKKKYIYKRGMYEFESESLIRRISKIGTLDLNNLESWNIGLSIEKELLSGAIKSKNFFICSIGTKVAMKDWGIHKWKETVMALYKKIPDYEIIFIGSKYDKEFSEIVRGAWSGSSQNLCGKLTVRESAAILSGSRFFLGIDSGPMHLAAMQDIPCVAIFTARALPGVWFPYGEKHKVVYHQTSCFGCELEECIEYDRKCIQSIGVNEVIGLINEILLD